MMMHRLTLVCLVLALCATWDSTAAAKPLSKRRQAEASHTEVSAVTASQTPRQALEYPSAITGTQLRTLTASRSRKPENPPTITETQVGQLTESATQQPGGIGNVASAHPPTLTATQLRTLTASRTQRGIRGYSASTTLDLGYTVTATVPEDAPDTPVAPATGATGGTTLVVDISTARGACLAVGAVALLLLGVLGVVAVSRRRATLRLVAPKSEAVCDEPVVTSDADASTFPSVVYTAILDDGDAVPAVLAIDPGCFREVSTVP